MKRFTVFTPTYNRASYLKRLYLSLCSQTFKDFEWIVVDDGSQDDTEQLIHGFLLDGIIPISYFKIENHGKHYAINLGVEKSNGQLFMVVDSDDFLPSTSLFDIDEIEKSIDQKEKKYFSGVCGLRGDPTNVPIGKTFSGTTLDIVTLDREKYGVFGDKSEVFYTNVIKKYPFPFFEEENFLTECVVFDKIAHDGLKMRFFNKVVYCCEYLNGGLTSNGATLFYKNPKGWATYLKQRFDYKKIVGKEKYYEIFNFLKNQKGLSFYKSCKLLGQNTLFCLFLFLFYSINQFVIKIKQATIKACLFLKNYSIIKLVHYNYLSNHIKRSKHAFLLIDRKSTIVFAKQSKMFINKSLKIITSRNNSCSPSKVVLNENSTWICNGGFLESASLSICCNGYFVSDTDLICGPCNDINV